MTTTSELLCSLEHEGARHPRISIEATRWAPASDGVPTDYAQVTVNTDDQVIWQMRGQTEEVLKAALRFLRCIPHRSTR